MAISSPIRLNKKFFNSYKDLKTVLTNKIRLQDSLFANKLTIKSRRVENERRKRKEEEIEAPNTVKNIGIRGERKLIISSSSSEGFLKRIIKFIGYLGAGWILYNIPTWIGLGKVFIKRIQTVKDLILKFSNNIINIFSGFGKILGASFDNLIQFDIFDRSNRLKNSFKDLTDNIDDMGENFKKIIDKLTAPLTADEKIPPIGQENPNPDAYDSPPDNRLPGKESSEMFRIAAALSTEGTGSQSTVDIMQVLVNRKAFSGGSYTQLLSQPGQFQGVENKGVGKFRKIQTLKDASKWSGVSESTLLGIIKDIKNPSLQSSAAKHVGGAREFRGSPQTVRLVNSDSDPNNNIQADSNGRIPGSVWRGGNGDNQFLKDPRKDPINPGGPAKFDNLPKPIQEPPNQQPPKRSPPSKQFSPVSGTSGTVKYGGSEEARLSADYSAFKPGSGAQITSGVGYRRGSNSNHTGYDVAAASGTPLYAYLPGKVTHIGLDGTASSAGYGNWIVWKDSVYGSYHFFGHMLKPSPLRVGSTVDRGTLMGYVGSTGISTGPHVHWEISNSPPTANGAFTSHQDPGAWTRSHPLYPKTSSISALTPSSTIGQPSAQIASIQNNNLSQSLTQERKGQTVIISQNTPQPQQKLISYGGESSDGESSPQTNEIALLNIFMKNKLLLDLAYL